MTRGVWMRKQRLRNSLGLVRWEDHILTPTSSAKQVLLVHSCIQPQLMDRNAG